MDCALDIRRHSSSSIPIACFAERDLFIKTFCYRKYLNRRIVFSSGHQGTFNPAAIMNKEVHMVHGNINTIKEVITSCKLILVNPATSATGERSFSTARRLKTWLRSRMNQERFSNLTVLNIHKERTGRLSTIDIANEFTDGNTNRKRIHVWHFSNK